MSGIDYSTIPVYPRVWKAWFTAAELAEEHLPNYPHSESGMLARIKSEGWFEHQDRVVPNPCHRGHVFHYLLLTGEARAEIELRYAYERNAERSQQMYGLRAKIWLALDRAASGHPDQHVLNFALGVLADWEACNGRPRAW